ncbi:MAG: uncharacterized protein QOD75_3757 [Blastocatellia bacterium]|jgi:phage tail sheath protein FI|nr:uncharacterized protein [Blastocatellia bacterium]
MSGEVTYPGVYIEEIPTGAHPIPGVSTSDAAFVDFFPKGALEKAIAIRSFNHFEREFGGLDARSEASFAIEQFFLNGGCVAWVVRIAAANEPGTSEWHGTKGADAILGRAGEEQGIYALRGTGFNILCLPAAANLSANSLKTVYDEAAKFCNEQRAFLIADIPPHIDTPEKSIAWLEETKGITRDANAAIYFPRVLVDPLGKKTLRNVGASGTMAGVYARTDAQRGVWKAPAGVDATLVGVQLAHHLTDIENAKLNVLGINVLRSFPSSGNVCWGARTLVGSDPLASEWKYNPVRRTALFIEASVSQGIQWAIYEPNDEVLWARIRLSAGDFMHQLFRQGAFQGASPSDAFFVKCDATTTTREDIEVDVVNIIIGFAPLKPAEFVVIKIQQMAGQTAC